MSDMCLESTWKTVLTQEGWSIDSAMQFIAVWQSSTLATYENSLEKLRLYCNKNGHSFSMVPTPVLADYLCSVAKSSKRPKSVLNTTAAALSCLSDALRIENPVTPDITKLIFSANE